MGSVLFLPLIIIDPVDPDNNAWCDIWRRLLSGSEEEEEDEEDEEDVEADEEVEEAASNIAAAARFFKFFFSCTQSNLPPSLLFWPLLPLLPPLGADNPDPKWE